MKHLNLSRDLRTFHADLAHAALAKFGDKHCPCCGFPLYWPRGKRSGHDRADRATVAHDVAMGLGGNPVVWVYACRKCNGQQGVRSFRVWAQHLRQGAEAYNQQEPRRRADRIEALADFIAEWCESNNVPRRLP